jgi:hypothetical protein
LSTSYGFPHSKVANNSDQFNKIDFKGCFPFAMVIGGFLAKRVGPRMAAAIGCYTMWWVWTD